MASNMRLYSFSSTQAPITDNEYVTYYPLHNLQNSFDTLLQGFTTFRD